MCNAPKFTDSEERTGEEERVGMLRTDLIEIFFFYQAPREDTTSE